MKKRVQFDDKKDEKRRNYQHMFQQIQIQNIVRESQHYDFPEECYAFMIWSKANQT